MTSLTESTIQINSVSNLDDIRQIVSIFSNDIDYFYNKTLVDKLHSGVILFFYLKKSFQIKSFCLLEITNHIVQMHRFRSLENSFEYFFEEFLVYLFIFGKSKNVQYFRSVTNFSPSTRLINFIGINGFKIYERFFMNLQLKDFNPHDSENLKELIIRSNIGYYVTEIIELIMYATKDSIDAKLYPEFMDFSSLRSLFVLNDPKKHFYCEQASFLLFHNRKLIGINLVVLSGNSSAIIWQLAVHPEYRRKKLGFHLMTKSIRALKEMGRVDVTLNVTANNPAELLYESLGFKKQVQPFFVIVKQY